MQSAERIALALDVENVSPRVDGLWRAIPKEELSSVVSTSKVPSGGETFRPVDDDYLTLRCLRKLVLERTGLGSHVYCETLTSASNHPPSDCFCATRTHESTSTSVEI